MSKATDKAKMLKLLDETRDIAILALGRLHNDWSLRRPRFQRPSFSSMGHTNGCQLTEPPGWPSSKKSPILNNGLIPAISRSSVTAKCSYTRELSHE